MPSSNAILVSEPSSTEDFKTYYKLRYEVLRKPWNEPEGSERDESDQTSIHAFIKINEEAMAVARLHFIDAESGQVRYMAVHPSQQGKGFGKKVIDFLEKKAIAGHRKKMILHARENAVKFYESCGYTIKGPSYLLFGEIRHFLMEKNLEQASKKTPR